MAIVLINCTNVPFRLHIFQFQLHKKGITVHYFKACATGADAVDLDEEDEFYEVDDLEEMHTAIINNDFDQVCPPELPV